MERNVSFTEVTQYCFLIFLWYTVAVQSVFDAPYFSLFDGKQQMIERRLLLSLLWIKVLLIANTPRQKWDLWRIQKHLDAE